MVHEADETEDDGLLWDFYIDEQEEYRWRARDVRNHNVLFVSAEGYKRRIDAVTCAMRAGWSAETSTTTWL